MIRIRLHGRGGHGIKTAGRIVGTAAFLAGHQVQDSPVYGAERRGAPVTAFTRIDEVPILERGVIESPDLIVIADETLLDDRTAAVLAGQETATGVFVNSRSSSGLSSKYGIRSTLVTFDISDLTRETTGKEVALSAGLAAAAARLTRLISADQLCEGVREELAQLHAGNDLIEKNIQIASRVFGSVPSLKFSMRSTRVTGAVHTVGYEAAAVGGKSLERSPS